MDLVRKLSWVRCRRDRCGGHAAIWPDAVAIAFGEQTGIELAAVALDVGMVPVDPPLGSPGRQSLSLVASRPMGADDIA